MRPPPARWRKAAPPGRSPSAQLPRTRGLEPKVANASRGLCPPPAVGSAPCPGGRPRSFVRQRRARRRSDRRRLVDRLQRQDRASLARDVRAAIGNYYGASWWSSPRSGGRPSTRPTLTWSARSRAARPGRLNDGSRPPGGCEARQGSDGCWGRSRSQTSSAPFCVRAPADPAAARGTGRGAQEESRLPRGAVRGRGRRRSRTGGRRSVTPCSPPSASTSLMQTNLRARSSDRSTRGGRERKPRAISRGARERRRLATPLATPSSMHAARLRERRVCSAFCDAPRQDSNPPTRGLRSPPLCPLSYGRLPQRVQRRPSGYPRTVAVRCSRFAVAVAQLVEPRVVVPVVVGSNPIRHPRECGRRQRCGDRCRRPRRRPAGALASGGGSLPPPSARRRRARVPRRTRPRRRSRGRDRPVLPRPGVRPVHHPPADPADAAPPPRNGRTRP